MPSTDSSLSTLRKPTPDFWNVISAVRRPLNSSHIRKESMEHNRIMMAASWLLRLVAAVILLQTLFFKFTGARESVYIFSTLGAEPWGRIGSGVIELIASVLLLIPATVVWGSILSLGVISGAIVSHLTKL